jgi:hypothetical protein
MPLVKSKSRAAVGKNIETEVSHGKPRKQAIAIALDTARRSGANWVHKLKKRVRKHLER